ncbi:hypothetical protein R4Z10_06190 [Niallia sp. XMNu-256]|uniref:hypothetical protein n=1 Tax=Niallia sp. XMNu-256 TaxID=3082444 RepID=UPI0030D4E849
MKTSVFSLAMESQGKSAGSAADYLGLMPFVLGAMTAPLEGIGNGLLAWPMAFVIFLCEVIAVISYLSLVKKENNQWFIRSAMFMCMRTL